MKTRIDLLRGMSKPGWTAVVNAVMSRQSFSVGESENQLSESAKPSDEAYIDIWAKGREKIKEEGIDWLRDRLVHEGEEVMKRYDQLLPVETRRYVL